MKFIDKEHFDFFSEKFALLSQYKMTDVYYLSIIYLLGIDKDTREHFTQIFDIEKGEKNIEALYKSWQTNSSQKVTRLAFNLWNSCNVESQEDYLNDKLSDEYNPSKIFNCSYAPYFFEAIRIRFPEHSLEIDRTPDIQKTARYLRVANKSDDLDIGLQIQKRKLDKLCLDNSILNYEDYIDNGFSGNSQKRPELQRLLRDIEDGKISKVLVTNIDRVSRNFDLLEEIVSEFEKNNVDLLTISGENISSIDDLLYIEFREDTEELEF